MSPFFLASSSDCRPQARPTQTCASCDRPNRPGLDQFDDASVVVARVDLRAHLGGDLGRGGRLANDPRLPDAVSQRLFAVDVLPQAEGGQRREGVGMLGRAHDDRVELARVVVELAEITASSGLGVVRGGPLDGRLKDVAEGHDVLGRDVLEVRAAAAADTDHGDVELLVQVPAPHDGREGEGTRRKADAPSRELSPRGSCPQPCTSRNSQPVS